MNATQYKIILNKMKKLGFIEGFNDDLETKSMMKSDRRQKHFLQIHLPIRFPIEIRWIGKKNTVKWEGNISQISELENLVKLWEVATE